MWEDKANRARIPLLTRQTSGTRLASLAPQHLVVFGTGLGCGAGEVFGLPNPHRSAANQVRRIVYRQNSAHRTSEDRLIEEYPWFQEYLSGNAATALQWSSSTQDS